jgi:hypothetical protein
MMHGSHSHLPSVTYGNSNTHKLNFKLELMKCGYCSFVTVFGLRGSTCAINTLVFSTFVTQILDKPHVMVLT